jgi:hypothetical protein
MKNFENVLAAYLVFWAVVFIYQFTVSRRLSQAEDDLEKLRQRIRK